MTDQELKEWAAATAGIGPGPQSEDLLRLLYERDRLREELNTAGRLLNAAEVAGAERDGTPRTLAMRVNALWSRLSIALDGKESDRADWERMCHEAERERDELAALVIRLAERIADQCEILSRRAERLVPAPRCDACRGRGRFDIGPPCHWCSGTGLRLPAANPDRVDGPIPVPGFPPDGGKG